MNRVREIQRINEQELKLGVKGSWHDEYRDSAYIHIGGLSFDLTEGDVVTIFSQWGEVAHIDMPRDKETQKPRGFAFLMYVDQRSTVLAVDNMAGAEVAGRILSVDHAMNYKQKGERDEEGNYHEPEEAKYNALPPEEDASESESEASASDGLDEEDPMTAYIRAEKRKLTGDDDREKRKAAKLARKEERAKKRAEREKKARRGERGDAGRVRDRERGYGRDRDADRERSERRAGVRDGRESEPRRIVDARESTRDRRDDGPRNRPDDGPRDRRDLNGREDANGRTRDDRRRDGRDERRDVQRGDARDDRDRDRDRARREPDERRGDRGERERSSRQGSGRDSNGRDSRDDRDGRDRHDSRDRRDARNAPRRGEDSARQDRYGSRDREREREYRR